MSAHHFPTRVWYEDTDLGGIVYYANYLKFIERARSAMIEAAGIDQMELRQAGTVFAVRRVEADYLAPARYGDELTVRTAATDIRGARVELQQDVRRGAEVLFAARVTIVCIGPSGAPVRIPEAARRVFAAGG